MKKNIDLHIHSTASSDGSYSPKEIVDMAITSSMKAIAIADHNSTKGVIEALEYVKTLNSDLKIIPAAELDCFYKDYNLHVLAYNINPYDLVFEEIEHSMHKMEAEAGLKQVALIEQFFDIKLNSDNLYKLALYNIITGEIIGEELLTNPAYKNIEALAVYRDNGTRSDNPYVNFYWDYCSKGKVAYVPMNLKSVEEIVEIIHQSGGFAVLAHPFNNIKKEEEILSELLNLGIKGIEVYSSYHDVDAIQFYLQKAKETKALITCGSDFHGKTKPAIKLGQFLVDFDEEAIIMPFIN